MIAVRPVRPITVVGRNAVILTNMEPAVAGPSPRSAGPYLKTGGV